MTQLSSLSNHLSSHQPIMKVYGTVGCHLCEQAKDILDTVQGVYCFERQEIDIIDLPELEMLQLAQKIPVIEVNQKQINWKFSVLDVISLLEC